MTWRNVRVETVAPEVRDTVDPQSLDCPLVEHYSIPSLEATGLPELVPPDEILSVKQVLRGGEVMVSRLNPRKARVLRVPETLDQPTVASGEFVVMQPTGVDGDFLRYALLSEDVRQHLHSCVQSVTRSHQRIRPDHLLKMPVAVPGYDTQVLIRDYLDRETARADELILKQELLIERLDEYRTALITQTVTRGLPPEAAEAAGLDPAPPLKDSGVEWLGEVPAHWQVAQLCRTVLFQRGHDLPVDDREPGVVPVVSSAGVTGRHTEAAAGGPAIVTGRYGSIGDFYVVHGSFWPLNTTLYSINLFGNDVMYVFFLLMSLKPLFLANAEKSAVPGVDRNDIHKVLVATPSRREQTAIAEYLDSQSARIDALRAKAEVSIERLSEYRSALVSAAVTGKIDVRDAARVDSGDGA